MIIFYLILFISAIGLTYLVRLLAIKKNIFDNPNERSSHTIPTPRGGGLAIVIVWFLGLGYLFWAGQIEQNLFLALLSGLVLAIVSLLDDIMDLKPTIRMLAQSISAVGALYFLGGFHILPELNNPILFWLINIGVFIGIIWFINLYNFLDGIDAYASQEAIFVAAGLLIFTGNPILGLLIVAVGGFLVWNWPKAKIFMGDVGSTQLGFILVVLGIYFHNKIELDIFSWLVLTSIFWFDASYTLFRRWRNKEKLSVAHKKHAYQRLIQGGFSHLKVDVLAIGLNSLLIGLVYLNKLYFSTGILLLLIVIGLLFFVNSRVDKFFPFKND
ncbi:MAG: glycosyltransferase family 4 protein [Salinivirgaceae bacterium]|nr:glycosyltransferase family 4 protein [Salinivirgaceae bacterium]